MTDSPIGTGPRLQDPRDALTAYAVGLHEVLGAEHAALSPLGCYLLLAAAATGAHGPEQEALERVLRNPAARTAEWLGKLLASPHPAIGLALALWNDPAQVNEAFEPFRAALPSAFATGPVPDQPDADAWANDMTRGLIKKFPLQVDPRAAILMASALVTQELWNDEYHDVPVAELETSSFTDVERVLARDIPVHEAIVWTESAGLVGACVSQTGNSLLVVSIIAEDGVPPHRVMAAAHEVAALACQRRTTAVSRSLFDLPVGPGHAWDIVEKEGPIDLLVERMETAEVRIPAWEATLPEGNLLDSPAAGITEAGAILLRLLKVPGEVQAAQATVARFDRYGFSAASVTAMEVTWGTGEMPEARGLVRHATVRFSRPFAVVAVTHGGSVWNGVPVFSAWVTRAIEPSPRAG